MSFAASLSDKTVFYNSITYDKPDEQANIIGILFTATFVLKTKVKNIFKQLLLIFFCNIMNTSMIDDFIDQVLFNKFYAILQENFEYVTNWIE